MGKIAKGKKQLGVVINAPLARLIEERAISLGISRSRFAAMIIEQWAFRGHSPVSEPDKLMQIARSAKVR